MNDSKMKKNIFKQSILYRFILLLMFLVNGAYVSIEIYKAKISEPLLDKSGLTHLEYSKIELLSHYARIFEGIFITLAIISIFVLFIKKYKGLLKSYIFIQLLFLISIFILNSVLSTSFGVIVGNTVRNLIGPFILLIGVLIYFVITKIRNKGANMFSRRM
ncbi:magnesium-transporting ATPase (P-type) [Virgibacillus natechei]|uniref:Magnesium-transporting ATPase (P-type) n=1 Tax=Virgibacillus natechei TaxID=1216297 RepID=A0ABS4IBR6_9BACI|nr:magnesium-transporting ATPase (P-type) [Virgibacillus natechei]